MFCIGYLSSTNCHASSPVPLLVWSRALPAGARLFPVQQLKKGYIDMCDYSLNTMQTRLAVDGEELVLHHFETGSLGFASVADINRPKMAAEENCGGFWRTIKEFFSLAPPSRPVPAVCIPPGSRLLLDDVPKPVQNCLCIASSEIVVFTEISNRAYSYRDALLLPNGTRVLLQDLPPGIHAIVLSTSSESAAKALGGEVLVA
jgi:hypothetical protein